MNHFENQWYKPSFSERKEKDMYRCHLVLREFNRHRHTKTERIALYSMN